MIIRHESSLLIRTMRYRDFTLPILAHTINEIAYRSTFAYVFDRKISLVCNSRDLCNIVLVRNRVWVNKSWLLDRRQKNPVLWDENVLQASLLSLSKQLQQRCKIAKSSQMMIICSNDPITCYIFCTFIYIFLFIFY